MPGLAGSFVVWPQAIGAAKRQHMQTNNSFVIFIFASLSIGKKRPGNGTSRGENHTSSAATLQK